MAKYQKAPPKKINNPHDGPRGGFQKPKDTRKTVRRLLHYIGTHPVMLVVAVLCVIASALASVAGTYIMRPSWAPASSGCSSCTCSPPAATTSRV